MLMKTNLVLSAAVVITAMSGSAWADDSICPAASPQPYHLDGYEFETTSGIDPKVAVPDDYKAAIRSCVHNTGKAGFVANWIIPRTKSWANPNGGWAVGEPIFVTTTKLAQLKGCLFYGNRGEHDYFSFMGVDADKPQADDEVSRGCRSVVFEPYPPSPPVWKQVVNLAYDVLKIFPSNARDPVGSGLELRGKAGVEQIGPTSYRSFLRYRLTASAGSTGEPSQVRIRPTFNGPAETLLKDLFRKYPGGDIRLGAEGNIEFEVQDVKSSRLQYVWYELYVPGSDSPVAGISMPLLVPLR
jgi:hypothetical protein